MKKKSYTKKAELHLQRAHELLNVQVPKGFGTADLFASSFHWIIDIIEGLKKRIRGNGLSSKCNPSSRQEYVDMNEVKRMAPGSNVLFTTSLADCWCVCVVKTNGKQTKRYMAHLAGGLAGYLHLETYPHLSYLNKYNTKENKKTWDEMMKKEEGFKIYIHFIPGFVAGNTADEKKHIDRHVADFLEDHPQWYESFTYECSSVVIMCEDNIIPLQNNTQHVDLSEEQKKVIELELYKLIVE